MKQTARNSTNDLHQSFLRHDPRSLRLRSTIRTPVHPSLSSTLFLRIFRLQVQVILLVTRGKKRERDSQFERKKETKTNRYRGIGLVWPYIKRVSSGWDRWLMHSREDEMEILSRSGGSRRRRRRSSSFRLRCSSVRLARIGWKRRDGKEG